MEKHNLYYIFERTSTVCMVSNQSEHSQVGNAPTTTQGVLVHVICIPRVPESIKKITRS